MSSINNGRHLGDIRVFRVCLGIIAVFGILFLMSPAANAGDRSPNNYDRSNSMQPQDVKMGTVIATREVVISGQSGTSQTAAYAIGAVAGSIIGASAGNGNGRWVAGAVGGTIGSLVGNMAGEALSRRTAVESIVRFDDGRVAAFTQEADIPLSTGEKVFVIGSYNNVRVVPASQMR